MQVEDLRTNKFEPPKTDVTRFARGSVISWRDVATDTTRQGIVLDTDAEADTLSVLDGTEAITVSYKDNANFEVLANSAQLYVQRVEHTAQVYAQRHGWCDVVTQAVNSLKTTDRETQETQFHYLEITATSRLKFSVRPGSLDRFPTDEALRNHVLSSVYFGGASLDTSYLRVAWSDVQEDSKKITFIDEVPRRQS